MQYNKFFCLFVFVFLAVAGIGQCAPDAERFVYEDVHAQEKFSLSFPGVPEKRQKRDEEKVVYRDDHYRYTFQVESHYLPKELRKLALKKRLREILEEDKENDSTLFNVRLCEENGMDILELTLFVNDHLRQIKAILTDANYYGLQIKSFTANPQFDSHFFRSFQIIKQETQKDSL